MKFFGENSAEQSQLRNQENTEAMVGKPNESENWQDSIALSEGTDGWVEHIDLTDGSDTWQDVISLDDANILKLVRAAVDAKSKNGETSSTGDTTEGDYPSTYKERVDRTPRDDGERGDWQGERGESVFVPNDAEIKTILEEYGIEGIEYKDGIPDFSPCAESTVEIDNMTDNRSGPPVEGSNFQQCDQKCAEQWNAQARDGRTDWTARDVANWRRENGYSWHERNDMKTCDLIPTKVNAYFGHLGGVGEYIRSSNYQEEGVFDE